MSNGPYIVDETCLVFAKNIEEENAGLRAHNDALLSSWAEIKSLCDSLRAENEKLRAALKPFADAVKDECNWKYDINVDDFRAAAAAIKDTDNGSV